MKTKKDVQKTEDKFYLQVKLPRELAEQVNYQRRVRKLQWSELTEDLFKTYLGHIKGGSK